MALRQLTETQIRTMTLEEKDRWWPENIYKGDMPQLTWRSALSGMCAGVIAGGSLIGIVLILLETFALA